MLMKHIDNNLFVEFVQFAYEEQTRQKLNYEPGFSMQFIQQ